MGIRVKAIERNVSFDKKNKRYAYVLQLAITVLTAIATTLTANAAIVH